MNILTDTHIFIWILQNNPKLSETRKNLLLNTSNDIWASHFSLMEIAIKLKIGKSSEIAVGLEFLAKQWPRWIQFFGYCRYTHLQLRAVNFNGKSS